MNGHRARLGIGLLVGGMALLAVAGDAVAAEAEMEADRFIASEDGLVVEAVGNVVLRTRDRVLRADRVVYRKLVGRITAEGGVTLTDPDGTVHSMEQVELSDDLREGAFRALRSQFANGAVLVAESALRSQAGLTEFADVAFTRCEICPDSDAEVPWRVRAAAATHRTNERTLTYRGVRLETLGVPIFYVPWFRTSDFSEPRAGGLLLPTIRSDRALGLVVDTPYFQPLGPSQDLLLRTAVTSREGLLFSGNWRRAGVSSDYRVEASLTRGSRLQADGERSREVRGHVSAKGAIGLDRGWSVGWDAARASDASYLARYGFSRGTNVLSQYGYLRKRGGRLHVDFEFYGFQNLSVLTDDEHVPTIFPRLRMRWDAGRPVVGGRVTAVGDVLALGQDDGRRHRRLSLETRWERTVIHEPGHVFETVARARADGFNTRGGLNDAVVESGTAGRFAPAFEVSWRFPFVSRLEAGLLIVEPVAQALLAPSNLNTLAVPNTDSVDVELSHATLFEANRFPGLDRIEGGVRANLGARAIFRGVDGMEMRGALGRVLRLSDNSDFAPRTGLADQFSDVVGSVTVKIQNLGTGYWNFRRSSAVSGGRHDEIGAEARISSVEAGITYVRLHDDPTSPATATSEQAGINVAWQVAPGWRLSGYHHRDLARAADSATLRAGLVLGYRNECVDLSLSYRQDPTRASDIPPASSVGLHVTLLGF